MDSRDCYEPDVAAPGPRRKPSQAQTGPEPLWPDDAGPRVPGPRPRRRIANEHLRSHIPRRMAAILHSELRAAAEQISATGGRGSSTAVRLALVLGQRVSDHDLVDLAGTAPLICRTLGLDVSDQAAREGLRRLAEHTQLVTAGSRHTPAQVRLRQIWLRGSAALEDDPLSWSDRDFFHAAVAHFAADLSQRSPCSAPIDVRTRGEDLGDPDLGCPDPPYQPDDRDLLGVPRRPGPPPSPRMVASLTRRGVRVARDLSKTEAAVLHRWRRCRPSSSVALNLAELRRFATPASAGVLHQLCADDVGALARTLSLAGLEVGRPSAWPVIDDYVARTLGPRRLALNAALGLDCLASAPGCSLMNKHRPSTEQKTDHHHSEQPEEGPMKIRAAAPSSGHAEHVVALPPCSRQVHRPGAHGVALGMVVGLQDFWARAGHDGPRLVGGADPHADYAEAGRRTVAEIGRAHV